MTLRVERLAEYKEKLADSPNQVALTRAEALKDLELAEELLPILGAPLTVPWQGITMYDLTFTQAKIRALCQGARVSDISYFYHNITTNASDITFPTASEFGVQIISSDGTYEIILSDDPAATMTVIEDDGTVNTFSTYFGNYYFVQSRETGSLIAATDSDEIDSLITPTLLDEDLAINPDLPGVTFGDELPFGTEDLTSVKGTWNERYMTNYISSMHKKDDADFVVLSRTLTDGLKSSYSRPELYVPLLLKRSIHDGTEDNPLRKHTPFAVAVVITEGMRINTSWLPIGNGLGDYSAPNASLYAGTLVNQSSFNTKLGQFNPDNLDSQQDTVLLSCRDLQSNNVETDTGVFPNKSLLPHFPAVESINELQATLGSGGFSYDGNDLFVGRYLYIENGKTSNTGVALPNYRFLIDTAAAYYFKVYPLLTLPRTGTYEYDTVQAGTELNWTEPQIEFNTAMDDLIQDTLILNGTTPAANGSSGYVNVGKLQKVQNYYTKGGSAVELGGPGYYAGITEAPILPTKTASSETGTPSAATYYFSNTGAYLPSASGSSWSVNSGVLYYYILQTPTSSDEIYVTKYTYVFNITVTPPPEGSSSTWTTTTTEVSRSEETILGWFIYNDVNDFRISDRYKVLANTIEGLHDIVTVNGHYDPYFEQSASPYNSGYTAQQNFKTYFEQLYDDYDAYETAHMSYRNYIANNLSSVMTSGYSYDIYYLYHAFLVSLYAFEPHRVAKISTINTRIGLPVYKTTAQADPNDYSDQAKTYRRIDYIPSITANNTSPSLTAYPNITPYGTRLYRATNYMLGEDLGYILRVFEKLRIIYYVYLEITKTRNKYEMLSDRSKQNYT